MKKPLILAALLVSMPSFAELLPFGKGTVSDVINPASFRCTVDNGTWIHNAGVVEPGVDGCDPIGTPKARVPQLTSPAADKPTATHRWWGSVPFLGEMKVGEPADAAYLTPDPISARISDRGVRLLGIPAGLTATDENSVIYPVPDPFAEVFDGIAVAHTSGADLNAVLQDHRDGSATVQWQRGNQAVMNATFVHGSPYAFFSAPAGDFIVRTKAANGPEKGIFFEAPNLLGIWTEVAGNRNYFLIGGADGTSYADIDGDAVRVSNSGGRMTIALLPSEGDQQPNEKAIADFAQYMDAAVTRLDISYTVDRSNNYIDVTHRYLGADGEPVKTLAGLLPLQWKNAPPEPSDYAVRSARGVIKFVATDAFTYRLPFIGVLPFLPEGIGDYDEQQLRDLINEFIAAGEDSWNTATDTYWAGKNYGKVAELIALARSHRMGEQADRLTAWLKAELEDWFTANSSGALDVSKYFVYDDTWNTLLGFDESFGSQQQLNDHHFHYGYFVRAAAEICRVDKSWCGSDAWGPMVELLIRDYAAGRNDPLFPYVRNFDPANGFSWASGHANFALGNNNESTSEAANAYGAIILYGMITEQDELVERGMYLHASSTASYWEYWNNLDGYLGKGAQYDNFHPDYDRLTTSIIWGQGAVFATWFSPAYAHILGIQGLPLNPLVMHVGLHPEYLADYVRLGLSESANGKPSGLPDGHWSDVWWNIWAMTDGDAAVSDFLTRDFDYAVEAGETKAHTYHWIYTFQQLGHLMTGKADLTADYPAAVAFHNNGMLTYIAYNFSENPVHVRYSDGMAINVPANAFGIKHSGDAPDTVAEEEPDISAPTQPRMLMAHDATTTSIRLSWQPSSDNVGVVGYSVLLEQGETGEQGKTDTITTEGRETRITDLQPNTAYRVTVAALDEAGNVSESASASFTTKANPPPAIQDLMVTAISADSFTVTWSEPSGDSGIAYYLLTLNDGSAMELSATSYTGRGSPGSSHEVTVVAVDGAGLHSPATTKAFQLLEDETGPGGTVGAGSVGWRGLFVIMIMVGWRARLSGWLQRGRMV